MNLTNLKNKDMSTFKKCQVLLLPTNEEAIINSIIYYPVNESLLFCTNDDLKFINNKDFKLTNNHCYPVHLYILSDEEIKEGDWFHLDMSDNMMDEELDDISIFSKFVSFVIRTTIVLGICCIALIFLIINVLTS